MMGEGNVERSKIRIVAIDRTPTSETNGLGETHAGLPLPEFSTAWEAEVGSLPASFCSTADHPSVPTCAAPAGARSGGQGWARLRGHRLRRRAASLTAASTT